MKKIILLLILTNFGVYGYTQVKYGISGGINLTSAKLESSKLPSISTNPRFGFHLGLGTEWLLKHKLSVISELKLTSKNYSYDVEDLYGASKKGYDRYNLMYIDMPVRLCYQYKNIRLFGGGYFNYLIDSKNLNKIDYTYNKILEKSGDLPLDKSIKLDEAEQETFPLTSHYPFDAGPLVGIGYHNNSYAIDLTYSKGLFNIFPETSSGTSRSDYHLSNQVVNLGFFFFL